MVTNIVFNKTTNGDYDVIIAKYNLLKTELNNLTKEELIATDVIFINITNKFSALELICLEEYSYENTNDLVGEDSEPFFQWIITGSYCFWSNSTGSGGGDAGGSAENSGGGILTSPIDSNHGGGGSSSNQPPQTLCETLNDAIQNISVNQGVQSLKAKTLLKSESAYQIQRIYDWDTETYNYTTTLKEGDNFNAIVQVGGHIKGQAHNHPINAQGIPSIGDIYWTMSCQENIYPASSYGYNITVCANPASPTDPSTAIIYAVTVDNLVTLTSQINAVFGSNFDNLTIEEKSKIRDELNDKYAEKFESVQNSSAGMEKKFLELFANFGISLYKFDNSTNNWNKLSLINNTVTSQPCEQL